MPCLRLSLPAVVITSYSIHYTKLYEFSGDNFSAYTPKPEPAAASLESEDESRDEVVQSQGQIDNEQADKGASEMAVNAGKELKQEFEGGESMAAA